MACLNTFKLHLYSWVALAAQHSPTSSLHAGMLHAGVARIRLHAGMAHAGVARSLHAGVAHTYIYVACRSGS